MFDKDDSGTLDVAELAQFCLSQLAEAENADEEGITYCDPVATSYRA